ncbi:MAG TPA: glutamate--tRNA ligase [Ferruginibacter sp.]|nr:glutamate--tRNA ligase [Ferruginibacter sp.]
MAQLNKQPVRVRFAPSPTGGLHLGGVRTVLYNYLFARQHKGQFILRIEDTDQTRYVEGAEQYIYDCLDWCGLVPDESPLHGGPYGPYRQSERKAMYRQYADQLIEAGQAYIAFDTSEELERMRQENKTDENPSPQYDRHTRMTMRNSLSLPAEEVKHLLDAGTPYVIRIKMPEDETVVLQDLIHGEVKFESALVDDKVLLKADGMPTYHLAVVVDDYLMKITHAFRGEEWLSSAPVHVMLWKYLFGLDKMPVWAHLPLIMGPQGKLSKRDGAKYGFPVFAMNWTDPKSGEMVEGFRERGFLPEAFLNMLAVLGWNDGTEQELFRLEELIQKFSMDRVHKAGARFDFDKAKWFNHEWIKKGKDEWLYDEMSRIPGSVFYQKEKEFAVRVIGLVKERCSLLTDFNEQAGFFYHSPERIDADAVKPKWNEDKAVFFERLSERYSTSAAWNAQQLEQGFKELASESQLKPGYLLLPFRIMLVGGKFGPAVFDIAGLIGREQTLSRIHTALEQFKSRI